jgi:hypothetical protein
MANKISDYIIDPNSVDGLDSSSNFFVPYEDLTISVELSTQKKSRTLLKTTSAGSVSQSDKRVKINFIQGETFGDKRFLTTKFTELTTSFGDENSSENLGITSIDIDFNSSFAPMITIQFIDIRGSAIFQNEDKTANNENDYSVFFQLPYPLYKLKIKGYYGQPVEYCLHMTKFTTRFNSQSGNFEITASFVGYTYAMLSDMLIGYLKAIPYTIIGKSKYLELKAEDPNLLTLDELYDKISKINEEVGRILSNSEEYSQLKLAETKIGTITDIRGTIQNFSETIDINQKSNTYSFAVINPTNKDYDKAVTTYIESVGRLIDSFNEINNITLDKNEFINIKKYDKLTSKILNDSTSDYSEAKKKLVSSSDAETTRKNLLSYITNNNYGLQDNYEFNVVDNTNLFKQLEDKLTKINSDIDATKKNLAEGLSLQVKSELDFDPSIRNIVKIFTTAAEVFMYCIYEVSKNASSDTNDVRRDELAKVFKNKVNSSDINTDATTNNGVNNLIPKYYPWPDYRKEKDKVLEDAYLGEPGVLDNPDNVPELFFIRDLLKAFIEQAQTQNDMDRLAESLKSNWVPSNPLDTRVLGNNLAPYSRINPKTQNELLVLTLTRAATFLGITNNETTLTSDEIIAMANFEAQAVMNDSPNKSTVVQSLSQLVSGATNVIKTTKGVINSNDSFVFVEENNAYTYRYILPENTNKYFPINNSFNEAEWPNNFTQLKEKQESGSLFLGNRYFYEKPTNPTNPADDGATYLRIVDKDSYVNGAANYSLPTGLNTESIINLTKLKDIEGNIDSVGFNCFGGLYGIQEFSTLDWGDEALDGLPLSTLFYSDSLDSGEGNFANGLAYFRSVSNQTNQSQPTTSVFDVKPNKYKVDYNIDSITDMLIEPAKMLHKDYGKTIDLMSKVKKGEQNISYPYIHFNIFDEEGSDKTRPISLFGSNLYYGQTKEESKAFLLLHTLPWNGLLSKNYNFLSKLKTNTIFTAIDALTFTDVDTEILNLFKYRAGFVYAPTLWVAFIGGLLWRYEETSDPIVFFDGTNSLLPTFGTNSPTSHPDRYPKKDEYLTVNEFQFDIQVIDTRRDFPIVPMSFINDGMLAGTGYKYRKIDEVLLKLPKQAKEEFKNFFLDFTKSDDWDAIKSELELKTQGTWAQAYQTATSSNGGVLTQTGSEFFLNTNSMKQLYGDNFDNYIIFKPYLGNSNYSKNYFLEIKDDSDVRNTLISVLQKEVVISNMSYRIWDKQNLPANQNNVSNVVISKENAELYVQTFLKNFEGMEPITEEQQKKEIKNSIFGTADDNLIKFMLYRTCKNMYDKWIAETEDGDSIFFQCGGRNITDSALANKRTNSDSANPRLIDSFRFVSRSFEDIGDRFAVNPFPIHDIMKTQPNTSLYDMVTTILSSNNFDFIALPSFINYRNLETVKSVFTPYPTYSDSDVSGPSFICMYVGQTSKHLDFKGSNYPNDGFDVRDGDIPTDFTNTMNDYEDPTVFFKVRFGQQNQNIFKDIVLDQSEFSETAESLQIMDDISKKGAETYRTLAGQNIYNVYSVRSYKVEVEMMGNAMIQPMMYFQLDNIPMFHGAYVITRVKHNIKPNHMTTNFTGSRIRKSVTPIFDAGDLYMSLIDTINAANINPSEPSRPLGSNNYIDAYVKDLMANPPTTSTGLFSPVTLIEGSVIQNKQDLTNRALQEISNWQNGRLNEKDGVEFLDVYVKAVPGISSTSAANDTQPWSAVFSSYIMLAGDTTFPKSPRHYDYVTAAMKGNNGYEAFLLGSTLKIKAEVGDLMCQKRTGDYTFSHCDVVYKVENNKAFVVGGNLSNSIGLKEIDLDNDYITKSTKIDDYKILVKKTNNKYYNSKNLIGTGIDFSSNDGIIATGPSADYWSLVAICALENNTDQGRCDVAQSIYNRLESGLYKSNTIKGLIIAKKQYEPVSRAVNEFNKINDKNTAIKAFIKSKEGKVSEKIAKIEIEKTINALKNQTLINSSKQFIGGRTDFYSATLKNIEPYKTTLEKTKATNVERDNQIFGWFVGPASIKYGQSNPVAANQPDFGNVV